MLKELLKPEIKELIEARNWKGLRACLSDWDAPEIAELLLDEDKPDRVFIFRALPRPLSAEVFSYLEPEHQDEFLRDLTDQETRHLLAILPPDDRTALLEELPGQVTRRLMNLLDPVDLKEARQLLGYPEESVGRLMTPDYVSIRPDWNISRVLEHARKMGKDSETINMIYVTKDKGQLLDEIKLRRLILADPEETVESLMNYSVASLSAFDDREEAVRVMQQYDLVALPVVDSDGVLIGIVTVDDVLDVAEEEATEDMQKGASVAPLRMSYHRANIWTLYIKRVGWLVALVFVNLISSGIIASYEKVISSAIALSMFIPLLIGSGGNTGSQSATLMIRALVTDDVRLDQWASTLFKELLVGTLLGVSLGLLSWALGVYRVGYQIGLIVGLTMLAIIVVSNIVGMLLPFILGKFKMDPAIASSPLIATLSDATGLFIYFNIAVWILGP